MGLIHQSFDLPVIISSNRLSGRKPWKVPQALPRLFLLVDIMTVSSRQNLKSPKRDFSDRSKATPSKAGQGLLAAELELIHGKAEPKVKVRGGKLRARSGPVSEITGAEAEAIATKYMATDLAAP